MTRSTAVTKKVLLIEDDLAICEMLATALRHGGFEVEFAGSREGALDISENGWIPELILLDYHMPGMSAAKMGRDSAATVLATAIRVFFIRFLLEGWWIQRGDAGGASAGRPPG